MKPQDTQKTLDRTLSLLQGKVVFVEGKHDVAALEELGVDATIVCAHGVPLRLVEKRAAECLRKGVVLLFDFDAEGRRKERVYAELLQSVGVFPLQVVRHRFERVFGARAIEELPARYRELLENCD